MGRSKKKIPEELSDHLTRSSAVAVRVLDKSQTNRPAQTFIAPELMQVAEAQDASGLENRPSWDVAIRFQDLKRLGNIPEKEKLILKRRAIDGVLRRARGVLGPVLKPEKSEIVDWRTFQESGARGEIDVLATLDENFGRGKVRTDAVDIESLRFDSRLDKEVNIALIMDASLSMTGEKIALLAVSAAVVGLCVPSTRLSMMGFDSRTRWVKKFGEPMPVETMVEKVLELPAGGFTNMEVALKETSEMISGKDLERANVILISDGKYTEGGDPAYLASRFRHLHVLKIGRDQAGRDLLSELASRGNGRFFEARKVSDLPKTMYSAMKSLLR